MAWLNLGVLTKRELEKLIRQDLPLIVPAEPENIKSATYDLRLGEEYIKEGRFGKLNEHTNPYLEIPQHDVVVASSYENVNLPQNVVGRFGIRLGLVLKGLVLANEPQIDPGSKCKLVCILYNLSDLPIIIPYKGPFATIEFQTTESEAPLYDGAYKGAFHLRDFAQERLPKSGLKELGDAFEKLREHMDQRLERFYITFFAIMAIIIAILGVLVAKSVFP